MSIGRKQSSKNEVWIKTLNNIESIVSRNEVYELRQRTIAEIESMVDGKNVAYGWSGGKDSIVLSDLCRAAGVTKCMFSHTELEYPEFLKWCFDNLPPNCTVNNVGLNLEWLSHHPDLLFPRESSVADKWNQLIQRRPNIKFCADNHIDYMIVGHRRQDGNCVGKNGSRVCSNSKGVNRYSPIEDWTHEELLAYIHYFKLSLPPIYNWYNGFVCGTHSWAERPHTNSVISGFREVYDIDSSIVRAAAEYFTPARMVVEEKESGWVA